MTRRAIILSALVLAVAGAPAADAAILVSDVDSFGGTGGVIRVDPVTGARTTLSENASPAGGPSFLDPTAITVAPDGAIFVADQSAFGDAGGGVIRVDPVTGARTTVSENANPTGGPSFVDPFGIALAANGDILVADQNAFGGGGGVIRVNPVTGVRTTVTESTNPPGGPTFDAPFGIAVEASGSIVVSDATLAALVRVDPLTGARTVLSDSQNPAGSPDFNDPFHIARAANGDIVVADALAFPGGAVISANPLTGARTAISHNSSPAGAPAFGNPLGIAVEANGAILVADSSAFSGGGVIRVDPLTGARTTVSENAAPAGGPSFATPFAIAVEPEAAPPPPPPAGLPAPVLGQSVNVAPVSGTVLIGIPGGSARAGARAAQKGVQFVPLTEARQIPVGSFLDTKRGTVSLTSAADSAGKTQGGLFSKGLFQVLQARNARRGLTELRLKGSSFRNCRVAGRGKRKGAGKRKPRRGRARAAARKRLKSSTRRRLTSDTNGSFRTRGRHSSATVRGTVWTMADRCDGTLTRVKRGKVAVRDFRRKKTVVLRAGKRYLARP